MKIATLTFHDTRNYGALLQTYALQKTIEGLGHDCKIINYENETLKKRYEIKPIFKSKNLKELIKNFLTNKSNRILQSKFDFFSVVLSIFDQSKQKKVQESPLKPLLHRLYRITADH